MVEESSFSGVLLVERKDSAVSPIGDLFFQLLDVFGGKF